MTQRFALRRCWASRFLWPMVRHDAAAEIGDGVVRVAMGWLGHAEMDAGNVARLVAGPRKGSRPLVPVPPTSRRAIRRNPR